MMALQRSRTVDAPRGSGERDRYVYLVPVSPSVGPSGFPVETDGTRFGAWAHKTDVDGQERFAAQQLSAPYTTRWEIDYRPELDPDLVSVPKAFVLTYEGRRFDIVTAETIGRKRGIVLTTLAKMG